MLEQCNWIRERIYFHFHLAIGLNSEVAAIRFAMSALLVLELELVALPKENPRKNAGTNEQNTWSDREWGKLEGVTVREYVL